MLSATDLHRLRGPAQLRVDEAEKLFEYIKSFGIISGQPREPFVKPISVFQDLVYLPEMRRGDMKYLPDSEKYDGVIQDWYNWNLRTSFRTTEGFDVVPPLKTNNPSWFGIDEQEDVILAVGVHYPATPSTEFYTADGRYRFSIAGDATAKELAEQLVKLANTPRSELLQTDKGWKHRDDNRYYIETHTISEGGKDYNIGKGAWFEKSNGLLNEPAIFMESIESAYDTNGHIFFIVGNPRLPRSMRGFNAINYKVIS